jgi:hypothetical protein
MEGAALTLSARAPPVTASPKLLSDAAGVREGDICRMCVCVCVCV